MTTTATRERPILFSAPMVRAILDGRKTQTRRVVKPQPTYIESSGRWMWPIPKRAQSRGCATDAVTASREWWEYAPTEAYPYGAPGDRLWVRETWAQNYNQLSDERMDRRVVYRADCGQPAKDNGTDLPWRPSIHMPRWASRITLQITDVRVERLQEITEADAEAEGRPMCPRCNDCGWMNEGPDGGYQCNEHGCGDSDREWFGRLWNSINAARGYGWDANPWVWVVSFTTETGR